MNKCEHKAAYRLYVLKKKSTPLIFSFKRPPGNRESASLHSLTLLEHHNHISKAAVGCTVLHRVLLLASYAYRHVNVYVIHYT